MWNSAAAAAYPAELNLWIAQAIAHLATAHREVKPHPLVAQRMEGGESPVFESDAPLTLSNRERNSTYPSEPQSSTPRPPRPERSDKPDTPPRPELQPEPSHADDNPMSPAIHKPSPPSVKKKPRWHSEVSDPISTRTRSSRNSNGAGINVRL